MMNGNKRRPVPILYGMPHPGLYQQLFRMTNGALELAYREFQKKIIQRQRRHWEPPCLGGIIL